jgi:hypothetical protein
MQPEQMRFLVECLIYGGAALSYQPSVVDHGGKEFMRTRLGPLTGKGNND